MGGREAAIGIAFVAVSLAAASPARAACPIELATYADTRGVAELEFTPGTGGATVSNSFRLLLDNDVVLDGIVQWLDLEERPWGMLMYKCPNGDVTGDDLGRLHPLGGRHLYVGRQGQYRSARRTGNAGAAEADPSGARTVAADVGFRRGGILQHALGCFRIEGLPGMSGSTVAFRTRKS